MKTNKLRIEAHGVRGMTSKVWRKIFRDNVALQKWIEDCGDVVVYGTREVA